mgnify:CR=1 FL=1
MQKAFTLLQQSEFTQRWINFEMMKSMSDIMCLSNEPHIIVSDLFDDEVLGFFHDKSQCRIVGPLVITYGDDEFCPSPQYSIP